MSSVAQPLAKTPWKQISLVFAGVLHAFGLFVILYAHSKSSYTPFKSKQLYSMAIGWIGTLFYILAAAETLQLVDPIGIFGWCNFWLSFGYGILGVSLCFLVMAFRMSRLYYLIVLRQFPEGFRFYYELFLSYLPILLLGIISTAFPGLFIYPLPTAGPHSIDGNVGCLMVSDGITLIYFLAVLIQLIHLWILTFKVSRIASCFNEFKENIIINGCFTLLWCLTSSLNITGLSYEVWGKLLIFWLTTLSGTLVWALPLLPTIIAYLFYREEYLDDFIVGLRHSSRPPELHYGIQVNSKNKYKYSDF
jgi:hypothetical protein